MGKFIDLIGQRFGRLLVIERAPNNHLNQAQWICQCDCGNTVRVAATNLKSGNSSSCGCHRSELLSKRNFRHGCTGTLIYCIYRTMIQRCYNPKNKKYKDYGGRGITIDPDWLGPEGFEHFLRDMGECPEGMSLHRVENDGPYSLGNCKWATDEEQQHNTRRNKYLTAFGISKIEADWAKELGCSKSTIYYHLKKGRDMEWVVEHFKQRNN